MRLSVSDRYPQVYRLATQGARNSVPSPREAKASPLFWVNSSNKASNPQI